MLWRTRWLAVGPPLVPERTAGAVCTAPAKACACSAPRDKRPKRSRVSRQTGSNWSQAVNATNWSH
eukprot:231698-Prorocentrum_minimum.AAC.1